MNSRMRRRKNNRGKVGAGRIAAYATLPFTILLAFATFMMLPHKEAPKKYEWVRPPEPQIEDFGPTRIERAILKSGGETDISIRFQAVRDYQKAHKEWEKTDWKKVEVK